MFIEGGSIDDSPFLRHQLKNEKHRNNELKKENVKLEKANLELKEKIEELKIENSREVRF